MVGWGCEMPWVGTRCCGHWCWALWAVAMAVRLCGLPCLALWDEAVTIGCHRQWLLNSVRGVCLSGSVDSGSAVCRAQVCLCWCGTNSRTDRHRGSRRRGGSSSAGAWCGMACGFTEARCGDRVVEAVAIASWLGEGGCHVAGVNRRAGRSAVGIGMWPPSAVLNRLCLPQCCRW